MAVSSKMAALHRVMSDTVINAVVVKSVSLRGHRLVLSERSLHILTAVQKYLV